MEARESLLGGVAAGGRGCWVYSPGIAVPDSCEMCNICSCVAVLGVSLVAVPELWKQWGIGCRGQLIVSTI